MKKIFKNYWYIILTGIIIGLLAHFYLYTGDDWFWVSSDARELLRNGFKHYNARFISNLIAMLTCKYEIAKCLCYAICTPLLFHLINKIVEPKNKNVYFLSVLLFFLLDPKIITEGYVWISSYVNYFITILILLEITYLIFKDKLKTAKWYIMLPFGIISSLFVENVSLVLLAINAFLIIYSKIIKEKKYNLGFLIGNIIGTGILLYFTFMYPCDLPQRGIHLSTIPSVYLSWICPNYFGKSIIIMFMMVILLWMLMHKRKDKMKPIELYTFSLLSIIYLSFYALDGFDIFSNKFIATGLVTLYYIYSFILIIKYTEKNLREHLVWYYILLVLYIAPLTIVYLIGPRLMMFPFVLNILIIIEILKELNMIDKLKYVWVAGSIVIVSFHAYTYVTAYDRAILVYEKINEKLENNIDHIELKKSEEEPYFHFYIPSLEYYKKYYIEYYNIDTKLDNYEITFVE